MGDGESYRYWREHGAAWGDEYPRRLARMPYYHVQELMLVEYVLATRPARVLEFGCGVGRHLANLAQIEDVDVYGYDQSAGMVRECRRWASPDWLRRHVAIGGPLGPLPYADATFDLVFTAEVLVHVAAPDLPAILLEIARVCRGHVLHLEPGAEVPLVEHEHSGSWHHDLTAAYASQGIECVRLPGGYPQQTPFRAVVRTPAPTYTWPRPLLERYRRLEERIGATIRQQDGELAAAAVHLGAAEAEIERLERRVRELTTSRAALLWNTDLFVHRAGALLRR